MSNAESIIEIDIDNTALRVVRVIGRQSAQCLVRGKSAIMTHH